MKLTGLILAFYLLLLAAIPCCAIDDCPDDQTEQTARQKNGDNDCGSCSPFFSCEGCAAATIACAAPQFDFLLILIKPVFTSYRQSALPEADLDFWQPPKWG